jgi:hypothetical protein
MSYFLMVIFDGRAEKYKGVPPQKLETEINTFGVKKYHFLGIKQRLYYLQNRAIPYQR